MEGKQSRPRTFDGKRQCKFCGERDLSKLVSRVICFRGKIVKRVVVCMKCLGKVLLCPDNEKHQDR